MTSPETRTQPFPDTEPRERRGSMIDDSMAEPFMREGRRGSDGSDMDPSPMGKGDRRMYEFTRITNFFFLSQVPMITNTIHRSKEWDASKTPPSRFQKVEGSVRTLLLSFKLNPVLTLQYQSSNTSLSSRSMLRQLLVTAMLPEIRSMALKRRSRSSEARNRLL